jgi:regulator of protease activity HflC (stomatin/prohibitin superfamily)
MNENRIIATARWITVRPWERAVVLRSGALDRTMDAGRHRRRRHEVWHIVDLRPRWLTLAAQEVLTADGLQVRVTPVALFRVVDPVAWLTEADEPTPALYTLAQLALRDALTGTALDEVLAARDGLLDEARTRLAAAAARLGAELLEFRVRDVTLPAELRSAYSETARAREEGRAKLERARADAAALRSMANAAQVLEAHPALLELRAIDAAGARGQFIFRIGDAGPVVVS